MTKINESNASGIRAALDILGEMQPQPEMDFGIDDFGVETDDAAIDRWHDGALDAMNGKKPASDDKDYMEGFKHGQEQGKAQVVEPERPEGYYHAPIGTFESEEEVEEAAEFDYRTHKLGKGEEFAQDASMPGKADAIVRYTPARASDNPMVEDISLEKSFLEYLKEAEEKTASDEEDESEN